MLVRFDPSAVDETTVILTWLVAAEARPGVDYDVEELTMLWRVTTEQDNVMVENQHAGLVSPAARPGPYSDAEEFASSFVARYLARMGARP
jgi:Rieske 2Fe-2S family protein